jgi:RNA polymerase primary sigma factor
MKQLRDQQTRYAPRERRLEHVHKAELLLGEIEGARRYPYEYLCYRITGFRPDGWPALLLDGGDVQHDLRLFVEDLSATARQAVEHVEEPVLTVDEVSRRYNVSTRTVTRWRRQGLVARRFVIDGRTKVGFLESSLQRFVTAHRSQVERGSRFRQLTEAERDEIIRRARRMALVRPGQAGLVEIARRIARKMSRSTETVRLTLRAYDRDHPDRAIFPGSVPSLDDEAKAQIYLRFRMGVSAEVLARQYGRTRSSVYRVINEMRAGRILGTKLELIDHPSFELPAAGAAILIKGE